MDIDWSNFTVGADRDGDMEVQHAADGCWWGQYVGAQISISEAMKLAEEHLKTCPIWMGE